MPAHIYLRLGQYDKAAERNVHAAAVDHAYIEDRKPTGIYPMGYYPHNVHFLWAARMMEGRSADAIKAARDLAAIFSPDAARQAPVFEFFVPSYLLGLVRFGKWDEILHQPVFPQELQYSNGIRHYARGLALVATGRGDEAGEELAKLDGIAQAMPGDHMINHNSGVVLLKIARSVLAGELAAKQRKTDEAVRHLREAIELQDGLNYIEPPDWYYPVRQSLGAVLLSAGRYAEAETVYREDLKRNPENGWSLYGLAQSLRGQKKADEAAQIETRFKRAWAHADVTLTSSRF
jgi:tetratricopeptide (TPR) repeat protein